MKPRRSRIHRLIQDLRDAGVREVTLVLEDGQTHRRQIGFVTEAEGDFLDVDPVKVPAAKRRRRK